MNATTSKPVHNAHVRTYSFAATWRATCTCGWISEFAFTERHADTLRDAHLGAHA